MVYHIIDQALYFLLFLSCCVINLLLILLPWHKKIIVPGSVKIAGSTLEPVISEQAALVWNKCHTHGSQEITKQ